MRGSVISAFSEPEEFEVAMSGKGHIDLIFTGKGRFRAQSTEVRLLHLRLASVDERLPRIAFFRAPPETILVALSNGQGTAPIWGGIRMQGGELITLGAGQCAHMRTEGPCRWGAIWLPVRQLIHYGGALTGAATPPPPALCHWQPPLRLGRQLHRLLWAAVRTTEARSLLIAGAAAAHGLEQQLIHLLVDCLSAKPIGMAAPAMQRRIEMMTKFEVLIRSHREDKLSASFISAALGVSARRLREHCKDHLGMSPMSYVRLYRMQQAHRTLQHGDPKMVRVAEVAERFGFHNPGRFAGAYRKLYGNLPGETLRRGSRAGAPPIVLRNRTVVSNARAGN